MLLPKYRATFILLHSLMIRIEKVIVQTRTHLAWEVEDPNAFPKAERPYMSFRTYEYSVNICRSLKYALHHDMESAGAYLSGISGFGGLVVHEVQVGRAEVAAATTARSTRGVWRNCDCVEVWVCVCSRVL